MMPPAGLVEITAEAPGGVVGRGPGGTVTGANSDVAGELSRIGREFAGWHPWVSSGGRWWATRKNSRRPANPPDWWAMTVDADDAQGLREAITLQEQHAAEVGAA